MRSLFPGCDLQTQPIPFTSAVTLGLKTRDGDNFRRSTNVGFGLTQAFPIFVEVLAASAGDLLLIENPEVHLHPGGQSRMGRFLALAAASGVQIVLETHSDHVLNGIRLAVRSGLVPAERVVFHYLTSKEQQVVLNMVRIEQDGTIRDWPKGFFDQFEEDLAALTGWSDS
jgi:predicted ATPase